MSHPDPERGAAEEEASRRPPGPAVDAGPAPSAAEAG
jgi:hypothetical protein